MALKDTQRIGPFPLGMDNRRADFNLALGRDEGGGHLLRDALNVDVTASGSVKTRKGYTAGIQGSDTHSLWAPLSGAYALCHDAGTVSLIEVQDGGALLRTVVATGFGFLGPVRYAEVNEAVYFTDGVRVGSYHPTPGPTPAWASAAGKAVGDQLLAPMPAGSNIAYHGGRLLVAVGSALIYSEPFQPSLRDEARGFELFPAPIRCIAAVEGGVIVVADKTYFIAGGFPAQTVRAVLPYGGPYQQAGYRMNGDAHWMSTRGIVSCSAAGEIANLQEARIAMSVDGSAATLMRESDGMRSIVSALAGSNNLSAGVGSYAQARIVKKESP